MNGGDEHLAPRVARLLGGGRRGRLLASLLRRVDEDGYSAVTVATVVDDAEVATGTFYKYFSSVEDCYLGAFDTGAELLGGRLTEAWACEEEWPRQVRAALGGALDFFAVSPELARLLLTEPIVASQRIFRRRQTELACLVPFLAEGRSLTESGDDLPETTEHGLLGSLSFRIGRKAGAGEAGKLPELLPGLTQFVLTPYLGCGEARRISLD